MRVTRDSLIRIAKETAQERFYNDSTVIAAYLTGSLVGDGDPLLGGTTDIDLVLVHSTPPTQLSEIVKLTPDFHVDIQHRSKAEFKSPRELRTDPILGYEMYDPMLLSQREKFFEFVQAGLRAGFEFNAPALVLARCWKVLGAARRGWMELADLAGEPNPGARVKQLLDAVAYSANSVAELNGGPLAERRFLVEFPGRAEAAERPDFTERLFNLLGASSVESTMIAGWLPAWGADFLAAAQDARADPSINAARFNYYEKAIGALLASERPLTALWPLMHTWTLASQVLEAGQRQPWEGACIQLGMLGEGLDTRISELDGFLDQIEIRLDEIAQASGVETTGNTGGHI